VTSVCRLPQGRGDAERMRRLWFSRFFAAQDSDPVLTLYWAGKVGDVSNSLRLRDEQH